MNKVAFLISHCESDADYLLKSFNENSRIEAQCTNIFYNNIQSFLNLANSPHKLKNRAAIHIDLLNYNNQFSFKPLYNFAKFIYLVRPPDPTLNLLVKNKKYSPEIACNYYLFRLRRICEMMTKTPGAVFLTWSNLLNNQFDLLENYLNLTEKLKTNIQQKTTTNLVSYDIMKTAEEAYERYYYFISQQNLQFNS